MIRKIAIENFKSVKKLEIELGRVTVLIGANGAGKSNILEGVAFTSAATADKIDNEFLASRGVRVSHNLGFMFNAFASVVFDDTERKMKSRILFDDDGSELSVNASFISEKNEWKYDYIGLYDDRTLDIGGELVDYLSKRKRKNLKDVSKDGSKTKEDESILQLLSKVAKHIKRFPGYNSQNQHFLSFQRFLIYAPENRELRTFAEEGQILPLGIRGEGLFRLLKILSQQDDGAKLAILKEKLQLIDWFEDFEFQQDAMAYERRLLIRDRHLSDDLAYFDQRSANEGFLFLLFYFCLFLSDATPPFFAIDNIDSSLNPKLCAQLVRELVKMAADNGKQAILTTHNPAVLDGLDLNDPEQKLYVVRRNMDGETVVSPVAAPKVEEGQEPVPLSEAFLRGYLGGLPTNF